MKGWKPARILYLILAIMLTFSVIPFIPFSINMALATEGTLTTFNIIFFMYDAIGLLIALTILTRARRDNYKSTGALLGLMTYALALLGHFLFYRYGQETLYFSHFFQAPAAEQLFRIIVILAVLTWFFNVMALVMSYIEVFDIRNAARGLKEEAPHRVTKRAQQVVREDQQERKVDDYKNIDPKEHLEQQPVVSHEYEDVKAEANEQKEQVNVKEEPTGESTEDIIVSKDRLDNEDGTVHVTIKGVNLSENIAEADGIAIDETQVDVKAKASKKAGKSKKKATLTHENSEDTSGKAESLQTGAGYVAQLTGDLFMDDNTSDKKAKRRKARTKTTKKDDKSIEPITADMLDDFEDDE